MILNKSVSIYRYNDYENNYERIFFGEVSLYNEFKTGAENGGLTAGNILKIRIPTENMLDIRLSDHIILGDMPFCREKALKIIAVSDNRRGANPHYRINAS